MDKKDEILQAALDLFVDQGFHGAPMADIAKRANVAAGTIYRYFPSKNDLINELFHTLEREIQTVIKSGNSAEGSIREKFLFLIRETIRYFIDHPRHFLYMEQYFNSPYSVSIHRDIVLGKGREDIWGDVFERGMLEGVIKDLPRPMLFALAFGPMIFLLRDHIRGFIRLVDEEITRFAEICWDVIKK